MQALDDVSTPGYPLKFLTATLNEHLEKGARIDLQHAPLTVVVGTITEAIASGRLSDHELVLCGILIARRDPAFSCFSRLCETLEARIATQRGQLVMPEAITIDSMVTCARRLPQGLLDALNHPLPNVRIRAVKALGSLGIQAFRALQPLCRLQRADSSERVREAAAKSAAAIERAAAKKNW